MTDNTTLDAMAGGDTIDTVDRGGVKIQRVLAEIADSKSVDAFGRLRVSNPTALFDSISQYDLGRLYWEEALDNSATSAHNANESSVTLTVTADASDKAVRQTREYFRYQPGKSHKVSMTGVFGAATSGVKKRFGYFDAENGIYFEQSATGVYNVVLRSKVSGSVVNTEVAQSAWGTDNLDGDDDVANPSGILLNGTKAQNFWIDLQWLSIGRVRVGLEIGGNLIYVHEFNNANTTTLPYMTTANLPCRFEIDTDGTNGDSFKTICTSVVSEGGFDEALASVFAAGNGSTLISSVTTRRPIFSIRPKLTFNSIVNRGLIVPIRMNAFTLSKAAFFEVVYGGTLTDASFASVNDDSLVESDIAATAISGGISLGNDSTDKKSSIALPVLNRYPMSLDISGAHPTSPYTDILTVVATSIETATNCGGNLIWDETR